jgi:hypothetical protein
MTSFDTTEDDVDEFASVIREELERSCVGPAGGSG